MRNVHFYTNDANYLRLDLESAFPVTVEYLLSANPRQSYFLNGKVVSLVEQDQFPLAQSVKKQSSYPDADLPKCFRQPAS